MHTFKYNDSGDWVLNELVHGDDLVVQNLKHLFRQRVTEWLFNEQQGFRHEETWEKKIRRPVIVQAVYDCAYQEPQVEEVTNVDYEYNKIRRLLKIYFTARLKSGITIEVNIDVNTNRV